MNLAKFFLCVAIASSIATAQTPPGPSAPSVATFYRQPPVFVENRGQWDGDFLYKTRVGAMTVFVQRSGWTFTLVEGKENASADKHELLRTMKHQEDEVARGVTVGMHFVGTAGAEDLVPGARSSGVHNYFLGNDPRRWRTDVPLYEAVRLAGVWPGVDVDARIEHSRFEYDVIVSPGADLSQVVIEVEGAEGLRLEADGTLVIDTALGPVRQPRAKTWQVMPEGEREPVACDYVLLDARRFGFSAPAWDRGRPLVIDPGLLYLTYLAGTNSDFASNVATNASGVATLAGWTQSTNFPTTPGAFAVNLNGSSDAVVTRLNAIGSGLIYSTFVGGGSYDQAGDVAVDASGAATVVGTTNSANFPTTAGAYDTTHNAGFDFFVMRLTPTGSGLVYSTYLGGMYEEYGGALGLDASGAVVVTGSTQSPDFPTTPGAYDTYFDSGLNDGVDVSVTRLNPTGTGLIYSTFLGAQNDDYSDALAVDASGVATVVGSTYSPNFPTTPGAYDTSFYLGLPTAYLSDAYVTRLNATGTGLVYSTFVGGASWDWAHAVTVDASGAATVAGSTYSNDFPTTSGAYDTSFNGGTIDAFVFKLNANGAGLVYSTYLGGSAGDFAISVALDASGRATVVGTTGSANFPFTPGAYDTSHNGSGDVFVTRLTENGSAAHYSTFFGTSNNEWGRGDLDPSGAVTVAGTTAPVPTAPGTQDAFVFRLQPDALPYPLMAFPGTQTVPVGGFYGLQVAGPAGAPVALMFDVAGVNVPVPPYGVIGVGIPPLVTFDGIGLGFPGSVPMPLTIGAAGMLSFSYSPLPANLGGMTLYAQAVAVHPSFAGGVALSTHGNASLPTPACQVTIVP